MPGVTGSSPVPSTTSGAGLRHTQRLRLFLGAPPTRVPIRLVRPSRPFLKRPSALDVVGLVGIRKVRPRREHLPQSISLRVTGEQSRSTDASVVKVCDNAGDCRGAKRFGDTAESERKGLGPLASAMQPAWARRYIAMRRSHAAGAGLLMLSSTLLAAVPMDTSWAQNTKQSKVRGVSSAQPEHIRELQEALAKSGYDPGPIDGIMGPRTKAALRKYMAVPPPKEPSPSDQVIARFRTERRESP
jgi:hypothetical protein